MSPWLPTGVSPWLPTAVFSCSDCNGLFFRGWGGGGVPFQCAQIAMNVCVLPKQVTGRQSAGVDPDLVRDDNMCKSF